MSSIIKKYKKLLQPWTIPEKFYWYQEYEQDYIRILVCKLVVQHIASNFFNILKEYFTNIEVKLYIDLQSNIIDPVIVLYYSPATKLAVHFSFSLCSPGIIIIFLDTKQGRHISFINILNKSTAFNTYFLWNYAWDFFEC